MIAFRIMLRSIAVSLLLFVAAACVHAQEDSLEDDFKKTPSPGQVEFASSCAACHGLDGHGSEKGPNIGNVKVQHLTDAQLADLISKGIPGTGMPPFSFLGSAKVRALVAYIRVLQGKGKARALPGDPDRGKNIFFGKGTCSTCHTISGEGGFLGPDLSSYGSTLSADAILKAIVNPTRIVPSGYKPAVITTRDGTRAEGLVRNEDNFSLQLQTRDGSFLLLEKSEVQNVEYGSQSLMPLDYADRLSQGELNDLISFLMKSGAKSKPATSPRKP